MNITLSGSQKIMDLRDGERLSYNDMFGTEEVPDPSLPFWVVVKCTRREDGVSDIINEYMSEGCGMLAEMCLALTEWEI